MKSKFYTLATLLAILTGVLPVMGQKSVTVTDTVLMGASNEVYYNMAAGKVGTVNRKQWDIAFRASRMSASILTNDGASVALYTYPNADISGWATIDTTGLSTWKNMVNSATDWETGAFDQNQLGHPDYGWGIYNSASHNVVGDSLYIIKLIDGSLRKLWIMEKFSSDNVFQFRFANLDGTGDTTVLLDCNPYSTKNFVGYSIVSKQIVDFEPVPSSQWDLLFTKYMFTYPSGTLQPVTGVLSNYDIKVNRFHPVAPDFRIWEIETMDSTRSPIGFDWKTFDLQNFVYIIEDSLVYFVLDQGGNIHKLVFKEFVGGTTGRIVFEKEMISAAAIGENGKSDLNVAIYPNPVSDVMNLAINPGAAKSVTVSVHDMSGRQVLVSNHKLQANALSTLRIPISEIPAGVYIVRMLVGENSISRKVIIN